MFKNIKNKPSRRHSGQSTVEYIVLVAAVIGVVIYFTNSNNPTGFKTKLNDTVETATDGMTNRVGILNGTHFTPRGASDPDGTPTSDYGVNMQSNDVFN